METFPITNDQFQYLKTRRRTFENRLHLTIILPEICKQPMLANVHGTKENIEKLKTLISEKVKTSGQKEVLIPTITLSDSDNEAIVAAPKNKKKRKQKKTNASTPSTSTSSTPASATSSSIDSNGTSLPPNKHLRMETFSEAEDFIPLTVISNTEGDRSVIKGACPTTKQKKKNNRRQLRNSRVNFTPSGITVTTHLDTSCYVINSSNSSSDSSSASTAASTSANNIISSDQQDDDCLIIVSDEDDGPQLPELKDASIVLIEDTVSVCKDEIAQHQTDLPRKKRNVSREPEEDDSVIVLDDSIVEIPSTCTHPNNANAQGDENFIPLSSSGVAGASHGNKLRRDIPFTNSTVSTVQSSLFINNTYFQVGGSLGLLKNTLVPQSIAPITAPLCNDLIPFANSLIGGRVHQPISCLPSSSCVPFVPRPLPVQLRPIVIDGSNVAREHGKASSTFSCKGIQISVEYFLKRGHNKVTVFVPKFRRFKTNGDFPTTDSEILDQLERTQHIVFSPSRCYDDRFIVQLATETNGVILSNDQYKDLLGENSQYDITIRKRLLMFCFAGDLLMIPEDPLGKHGPRLREFLSLP